MNQANQEITKEVEGSKMTEFLKKPMISLIMQGGFMGVLIFVLWMNYNQTDRFMTIYEEQSKESAASQVELARALQSLTDKIGKD